MGIDASIALQAKPSVQIANPLDIAQQAMTMKRLAQQNQAQDYDLAQQQNLRGILSKNITTDANGNSGVNQQAVLSDLYKTNPMKAMEMQKTFNASNLEDLKNHSDIKKSLVMDLDPKDPQSYEAFRQKSIKLALPGSDHLPEQYPGPQYINQIQHSTLSYAESLDRDMKQKEFEMNSTDKTDHRSIDREKLGLEQSKNALEMQKLYGGAAPQGLGANGETDPAKLVPFKVPQHHQATAFKEIESAQNTAANHDKIMEAFDNAAKNYHAADLIPGIDNADQKSLHALMGPTFKDVEGTVRQAAMDNMAKNTTPQVGDDENTIKTKRNALEGYLSSKMSAPTAMGYGIDLSKFASTSPKAAAAMKSAASKTASPDESASTSAPPAGTIRMLDPKGTPRFIKLEDVGEAIASGGRKI
jgi:hypothetical protein